MSIADNIIKKYQAGDQGGIADRIIRKINGDDEKKKRLEELKSQADAAQKEADYLSSPLGLAVETVKGVGSSLLDMGKEVARMPLTLPLKATQSIAEGITGNQQTYTPENGLEKFMYGDGQRNSVQGDVRNYSQMAQDYGIGEKSSVAFGGLAAGAGVVLDYGIPGASKVVAEGAIGRAVKKFIGKGAETKIINAQETKQAVDEISKITGRQITPEEENALLQAFSEGATKDEIVTEVGKENIADRFIDKPKLVDEVARIEDTGVKLNIEETQAINEGLKLGKTAEESLNSLRASKSVSETQKVEKAPEALKEPKRPVETNVDNNEPNLLQEAGIKVYRGGTGDGKYFSTSKSVADDFAKNRGGSVSEHTLKPDAKVVSYSDFPDAKYKGINDYNVNTFSQGKDLKTFQDTALESDYVKAEKWAKQNGYDAIKLPTEGEIRVINNNSLYNKAQGGTSNVSGKKSETYKGAAYPETRKNTLGVKVERLAVEKKLSDGFGDLPEYKTVNMKDQAEKAAAIVESDYEKAVRIAFGKEDAPDGVLPESVYVAVENKALKEGDVETLRRLATESTRVSEATVMGQRIRTLGEREPDSAVTKMQEVVKSREAKAEKKTGKKASESVKSTKKAIKSETKRATSIKKAEDLLNSLICT